MLRAAGLPWRRRSLPPSLPVPEPLRVAVLASGGGSNLQALLDRCKGLPGARARVALVVGSRAGIGALARAEVAGAPGAVVEAGAGEGAALLALFGRHRIDLVVLAGYLRLIPAEVVSALAGRIINIHPSLLPAFGGRGMYGLRVHRAVVAAGVRVSGVTVHRVERDYDTGEILAQWPVPVWPGDTAERLAERVLATEHRLLPAVVDAFAGGGHAPTHAPGSFGLVPDDASEAAGAGRLISPLAAIVPR